MADAEPRNNRNLKRIKNAFRVSNDEIVDIMARSGLERSKSHVAGWLKRWGATRSRDHSITGVQKREQRYREMTDEEFDAFCEALVGWAHEMEAQADGND